MQDKKISKKNNSFQTLKIGLAALFHDIGKIFQYYEKIPEDYYDSNVQFYLKDHKTHFSHQHAIYTAYFLEKLAEKFLPKELLYTQEGEEYFVNLAAKHHTPETPLQWIIAEADRLSSGLDRQEFEKGENIPVQKAASTRLLSIFEKLDKPEKEWESLENFEYFYPLEPISPESIFPKKKKATSSEESKNEYKNFAERFLVDFKKLFHKNNPFLWARNFDSLYSLYASQVPAARVGKVIPDVSLYDHSRATASLAIALYKFHLLTNSLEEKAIKDEKEPKFLLVSGDFYGIQKFIFSAGGEEKHHRAKLLRGRSFAVSLFSELLSEKICEELGLSFLSIIMSQAGKFHLIAPNHEKIIQKLEEIREKINIWFLKNFYGETSFGICWTSFSPEKLKSDFNSLWNEHAEKLAFQKLKKFKISHLGVFEGYLDSFNSEISPPVCPICGKRPYQIKKDPYLDIKESEKKCACKLCRDHIFLGTKLVKNKVFAIYKSSQGELKEPIFDEFQIEFFSSFEEVEKLNKENCLGVWAYQIDDNGEIPYFINFLPLNGHVPVYTEEDKNDERILYGEESEEKKIELIELIKERVPKTFYHLAKKAFYEKEEEFFGVPYLASFKADVDNLGVLFACGIPAKFYTLSRIVTLSRRLHHFFSLYLPYLLKKDSQFKEVYTLFAGGDDLFLIGPWNTMLCLCLKIYQDFKNYVCHNPQITLSGGIAFHKASTPVHLFEEKSEEALEKSKSVEGKNSVTIWNVSVKWNELEKLFEIMEKLFEWFEKGKLTKSNFYRINEILELAKREEKLLKTSQKGVISWQDLQAVKWRAFLGYFITRWHPKKKDEALRKELIEKLGTWIDQYRSKFTIPLWTLLYETRKARI